MCIPSQPRHHGFVKGVRVHVIVDDDRGVGAVLGLACSGSIAAAHCSLPGWCSSRWALTDSFTSITQKGYLDNSLHDERGHLSCGMAVRPSPGRMHCNPCTWHLCEVSADFVPARVHQAALCGCRIQSRIWMVGLLNPLRALRKWPTYHSWRRKPAHDTLRQVHRPASHLLLPTVSD